MNSFTKDPEATLDWLFDWSKWLAVGETITGQTVTATAGITVAPSGRPTTSTPTAVTVWLAGGTAGSTYTVACRITTSAGRTDERSIEVLVLDR